MKTRRHHNNKGYRQIKRGKTREQVKAIAKRLGIKSERMIKTEPFIFLRDQEGNPFYFEYNALGFHSAIAFLENELGQITFTKFQQNSCIEGRISTIVEVRERIKDRLVSV